MKENDKIASHTTILTQLRKSKFRNINIDGIQSHDKTVITTIKANSQKTFSSFVLCTNMATMTSSEYGLYVNTTGQEFISSIFSKFITGKG